MLIPDHEADANYLNCTAISLTVGRTAERQQKRTLTVGMLGDWSAGKSSTLKIITTDLNAGERVAVLWFNG